MLRLPLSIASPGGRNGRLSILIFHRVLPRPDPLFPYLPDAASFEAQMRWVRDWFVVLPLAQAVERLYTGSIPARALAISFDDGYADNEEVAAPILQRLGMTATIFISTGYLDGGCMWNDRLIEAVRGVEGDEIDLGALGLRRYRVGTLEERRDTCVALVLDVKHVDTERRHALVDAIVERIGAPPPAPLMMSQTQVRNLRILGMDVGAHTVSHPILTRLPAAIARDEIASGKEQLEALLGERIELFAYPNGLPRRDYASEHVEMVRGLGFSAAVSTARGAASTRSDRFQLPRFPPWDRERWRYGARLLGNLRKAQPELA